MKPGTLVRVFPLLNDLNKNKLGIVIERYTGYLNDITKIHEISYDIQLDYTDAVYRVKIGRDIYLYSDFELEIVSMVEDSKKS